MNIGNAPPSALHKRVVVVRSVQKNCTFWAMTPRLSHDTVPTMRSTSNTEQYDSAVARVEDTARNNGHALAVWYPVDPRLRASMCVACGAMVWVSRPGHEKGWRLGGKALEQECLLEDRTLLESGA